MYIVRPSDPVDLISEIGPQSNGSASMTSLDCSEAISLRDDGGEISGQLFKVELLLVTELDHCAVGGGVCEEGLSRVQERFGRSRVLTVS
jgi:hypothetical protein